jgi:hypothetical protein
MDQEACGDLVISAGKWAGFNWQIPVEMNQGKALFVKPP